MRDDAEHSNRRRREGCIQSTNVIHFVITKKGGKKVLLKLAGHGFFSHKLQNVDSWYFKFYVLDVDDFLQTFIQQSFVCDQPILNKNGLKCLYISEKIHYRRTYKCKREEQVTSSNRVQSITDMYLLLSTNNLKCQL